MTLRSITKKAYDELFYKSMKELETRILNESKKLELSDREDLAMLVSNIKSYNNLLRTLIQYQQDYKKYRIYHYLEDNRYLVYRRGVSRNIGFKKDK